MLTIGTFGKKTGTKVQTNRYCEQIGLMPEPGRTEGGQRRYGNAKLDRLSFIRHARQLGFSLEAIRKLLDLSDEPNRPCHEADVIARRQLKHVEQRIARLEALRTELQRMVLECSGGSASECRVLEVLRDCLTSAAEKANSSPQNSTAIRATHNMLPIWPSFWVLAFCSRPSGHGP